MLSTINSNRVGIKNFWLGINGKTGMRKASKGIIYTYAKLYAYAF